MLVDKLATVVPTSDSPVESDAEDCEAVEDNAASPEDTPATPEALLAAAVDSDVTD